MTLVPLGFRVLGVPRTQAVLRRFGRPPNQAASRERAEHLIRISRRALVMAGRIAGRYGTCLSRSFALWTLLRRRGVETELAIGYRRSGEKIEGHAWLEFKGAPINEEPAVIETYTLAAEPRAFDTAGAPRRGSGIRWT